MRPALPLEILVAGAVTAWLLILVPAAAITVMKGRWDLFSWGFLGLGLPWIGGAVTMAPADSDWAQRWYSEEQRARAKLPFGRQYTRRTVLSWCAVAAMLVVLLGTLVVRPAPVLGIDGDSLGGSLPHRGGDLLGLFKPLQPCEHESGRFWTCDLYDPELSGGTIAYEVKVNGRGCWNARPSRKFNSWGKLHGCIWIANYLE